jgi:hypothetical protein
VPALAHGGGFSWDEALIFFGPVVLFVILRAFGMWRERRRGEDEAEE